MGGRYSQLDGLRALAVMGVVVSHTLDPVRHAWSQHGAVGVQLFFVLSGFLITGILIDARTEADAIGATTPGVLRSFYARRSLRIFPVYYATIAVGTAIGVSGMRDHLGWNLAYLSNWRVAADGEFGAVTHIWSLAVEEQFYLLWPLVVLFMPRRFLAWAIAAMIATAVMTRFLLTLTTDLWTDGIAILTPSAFDSLGLGALLSWLWRWRATANDADADSIAHIDRVVDRVGMVGVAVWVLDLVDWQWGPSRSAFGAITVIWWSLVFMWIVHRAARGRTGALGRVLTFRPLAYLGTISYGVYLFHLFVVPVAEIIEGRFEIDLPVPIARGPAQFVVVSAASIAAAAMSWAILERPINRIKYRFPYVAESEQPTTAVVVAPRR